MGRAFQLSQTPLALPVPIRKKPVVNHDGSTIGRRWRELKLHSDALRRKTWVRPGEIRVVNARSGTNLNVDTQSSVIIDAHVDVLDDLDAGLRGDARRFVERETPRVGDRIQMRVQRVGILICGTVDELESQEARISWDDGFSSSVRLDRQDFRIIAETEAPDEAAAG